MACSINNVPSPVAGGATSKSALRAAIRDRASQYDQPWRLQASERIMTYCERLPQVVGARRVALYWSLPEEVQTHQAVERWSQRHEVYLPVMTGDTLELKRFESRDKLHQARFGVWEPDGSEGSDLQQIDLIVVPAVAFDRQGNRLGHGKGFYDRLLEGFRGEVLGVCFDYQLVAQLPVEPYDHAVDLLVSGNEQRVQFFECVRCPTPMR